MEVHGGYWQFLTGDLDDRIIFDVVDYWKFCVDMFIKSVSRMGVFHGGTLRTLRVPDRRLWGQGHPLCCGWPCLTQRKIPWKFHVDIFITSVSRMGDPSWGYFEDIQGSWKETWRTGSSLRSLMYLVDPKNHILSFVSLSLLLADI